MSQSDWIFAYLFIAFAAFITLRGELPAYAGLLLLSPPNTATASNSATTNSSVAGAVATGAETAVALI